MTIVIGCSPVCSSIQPVSPKLGYVSRQIAPPQTSKVSWKGIVTMVTIKIYTRSSCISWFTMSVTLYTWAHTITGALGPRSSRLPLGWGPDKLHQCKQGRLIATDIAVKTGAHNLIPRTTPSVVKFCLLPCSLLKRLGLFTKLNRP